MTAAEKTLRALLTLAANLVHPSPNAITCIRARTGAPPDREAGGR